MNELVERGFESMNGFRDGYKMKVSVKNEHKWINTWDE